MGRQQTMQRNVVRSASEKAMPLFNKGSARRAVPFSPTSTATSANFPSSVYKAL